MKRFVILDRDGTINVDAHYLSEPEQLDLLPGAVEGLRRLRARDLGLVVVTNQSGVARGYFDRGQVDKVNAALQAMLSAEGVDILGTYVCPHGPDDGCDCRKPRPGLVEQAAAEHGFDPGRAVVVGDKAADIKLGQAVGARTILVLTGKDHERAEARAAGADAEAGTLKEAALVIEGWLDADGD